MSERGPHLDFIVQGVDKSGPYVGVPQVLAKYATEHAGAGDN